MKRIVLLLALAALMAGSAPRARAVVDGASTSVTLAQDEHDHVDPAAGVDERPWVNLAFPVAMIAGGALYLALTRRRHRKQ